MITEKAVILARGLGTRMRRRSDRALCGLSAAQQRAADSGQKAMMPIERPFLDYVLTELAAADVRHVCLVIGPEHEEVRSYYRQLATDRLTFDFAVQHEPRGTADAVAAAEAFAAGDAFLCLNGDNFYPRAALRALQSLHGPGLIGFDKQALVAESNIPAERVNRFAAILADRQGGLQRIVEKPDAATAASLGQGLMISMNCWRFGPRIFQACRRISLSPRGELELTDAVQYAMENLNERFAVVPLKLGVLDLTSREDVGPVHARLRGMEVCL